MHFLPGWRRIALSLPAGKMEFAPSTTELKAEKQRTGRIELWRASFSINNLFRRIINRPLEATPHIIEAQQERAPASQSRARASPLVVMTSVWQLGLTTGSKFKEFMAILRGNASKRERPKSSL